jgi:hypothetical protein
VKRTSPIYLTPSIDAKDIGINYQNDEIELGLTIHNGVLVVNRMGDGFDDGNDSDDGDHHNHDNFSPLDENNASSQILTLEKYKLLRSMFWTNWSYWDQNNLHNQFPSYITTEIYTNPNLSPVSMYNTLNDDDYIPFLSQFSPMLRSGFDIRQFNSNQSSTEDSSKKMSIIIIILPICFGIAFILVGIVVFCFIKKRSNNKHHHLGQLDGEWSVNGSQNVEIGRMVQ